MKKIINHLLYRCNEKKDNCDLMGFSAFANLNGTKPKKHKTLYLFTDERKPFCAIHYRVTIVLSDTPESKIQGQDDVRLLKFSARSSNTVCCRVY